eukprot:661707-Rhodomonas_salina.1
MVRLVTIAWCEDPLASMQEESFYHPLQSLLLPNAYTTQAGLRQNLENSVHNLASHTQFKHPLALQLLVPTSWKKEGTWVELAATVRVWVDVVLRNSAWDPHCFKQGQY